METVLMFSVFIQAVVVVLSMIALGHVQNRRAWVCFIVAALLVFIRRATAGFEYVFGLNTDMIERLTTLVVSALWILFILHRTDWLRKTYKNGKD